MEDHVTIPENVDVKIEDHSLIVNGPKGQNEKKFCHPKIHIKVEGKEIRLSSKKNDREEKRILNTFSAHIKNMIVGVVEGYFCKLKICSGHFPMKVVVDGNRVVISNFLGETIPRKSNIIDGVKVKINGDIIDVDGLDIEDTMQTAANIERSTRITNRDRRVFQDGCYILR